MPRQNRTIPHQPYMQTKGCDQKRRYSTRRQAEETAEYQMLIKPSLELAVYKCPDCNGWHLTRRKDADKH